MPSPRNSAFSVGHSPTEAASGDSNVPAADGDTNDVIADGSKPIAKGASTPTGNQASYFGSAESPAEVSPSGVSDKNPKVDHELPLWMAELHVTTGHGTPVGAGEDEILPGAKHHVEYRDPTPKTPRPSNPPSRTPSDTALGNMQLPARHEDSSKIDQKHGQDPSSEAKEAEDDNSAEGMSRSEIQNIMEQFKHEDHDLDRDSSMSRIVDEDKPQDINLNHPPRNSSLELRSPTGLVNVKSRPSMSDVDDLSQLQNPLRPDDPPRFSSVQSLSRPPGARSTEPDQTNPTPPMLSPALNKSLPPAPDPEPDLPFDFHRFLEQLRHRTADPVAKFLRSFLVEFSKKQWMVHEQVKIISDFLTFITNKMGQCEVWRELSDAEFDNAREGMEKLVMNRLYSQTFSPAIPLPVPVATVKGKRKAVERQHGPGRRGQHQEDIERDEILAQKVRIYGWVREQHLDIAPVGDSGRRFLSLAQQELLKIKSYRAPRDKVICVLNCCKVIFGLLRNSISSDTSADSFVPLLIYVVLQANPDHLVSNIQYILRFRNQEKLGGEAGYYVSSLMGAIQFIESLDRTVLTISDEEFEKNVEAAVFAIAERDSHNAPSFGPQLSERSAEKADLSNLQGMSRRSFDMEQRTGSSSHSTGTVTLEPDEKAAGILFRTIKKPLSSIGRIFSEDVGSSHHDGNERSQHDGPVETPRRLSPAVFQPPRTSAEINSKYEPGKTDPGSGAGAEDAAARQASAEVAEAHRIQRAEHQDVVETLASMFPNLDKDVIDDVVRLKEGRVGLAVDACLALNT